MCQALFMQVDKHSVGGGANASDLFLQLLSGYLSFPFSVMGTVF